MTTTMNAPTAAADQSHSTLAALAQRREANVADALPAYLQLLDEGLPTAKLERLAQLAALLKLTPDDIRADLHAYRLRRQFDLDADAARLQRMKADAERAIRDDVDLRAEARRIAGNAINFDVTPAAAVGANPSAAVVDFVQRLGASETTRASAVSLLGKIDNDHRAASRRLAKLRAVAPRAFGIDPALSSAASVNRPPNADRAYLANIIASGLEIMAIDRKIYRKGDTLPTQLELDLCSVD